MQQVPIYNAQQQQLMQQQLMQQQMLLQPGMMAQYQGYPPQMGFPPGAPRMPLYSQPMMPGAPDLLQQFGQMALSGMVRPQQNTVNRKELKAKMGQAPSVHVSNLPKENFLDLDLYKFFTSHGFKIRSAKVVLHNKTSKSLQYGYVTFYTEEELSRCLAQMNNFPLVGLPLCLTRCSADPKAAQEEKKDANLLVKNVADSVQQKELFELFNSLGRVLSCKLEYHHETKQSKGFAFIQYENVEDAAKALATLNGKEVGGKKLEISVLKKKEGKTEPEKIVKPAKSLFVKNFPRGTTEAGLAQIFGSFGTIESVKVEADE